MKLSSRLNMIRTKYYLQLLLCFVTGLIASSFLLGSLNHDRRSPVTLSGGRKDDNISRSSLSEFHITGTKWPEILPDIDTRELIGVLQQKLKDLSSSGVLQNMVKLRACRQREKMLSRCIEPNCTRPLPPRLSVENIESIRKPLKEVGMDRLREVIKAFNVTSERKKYVFVTGASSNHFLETEASIKSLHGNVFPHLTNYSFIYYDLGLTDAQRKLVRDFSGAELKTFPYKKLPASFKDLTCYTWKPLIVMAHLPSSEFLIWMDSSIRYARDIRPYFDKVSKTGILIDRNGFPFPQNVYLKMFSYFGDEPCQFTAYGEVEGGFLVLHNEPFTRHLVIEPWGACALDPSCMCPERTRSMSVCPMNIRKYGKCHRYDQATIGYILIKLLQGSTESVILKTKHYSVARGQRGSYMADLQKAKKSEK